MGRLIDTDVVTLDELIDPVQHQWRSEKIHEIFLAPDARAILQIPLCRSAGDDWLAWHYEKSGVYSVRSAYRALLSSKESREAAINGGVGHSNLQNVDKWKRLWKLNVLPRVRVFWWRVLKGILPDYATLTRRHVRVHSTCSVCNSASETLYHAMMECGHAKQFWNAAREILHLKLPNLHPDTWAMDILCDTMFSQGERESVISIMSAIWDSRNRWTHDDKGYDPSKTMETIAETMGLIEVRIPKMGHTRPPCTWQGPGPNMLKLNCDGAIREEQGIAGGGGVARDERGFRAAWCRLYHGISDPLSVEALAFRDAVAFAQTQGYVRIWCESDCAELVSLWKERKNQRSLLAPLFSEIDDISSSFKFFDFSFVGRLANKVVHECARYACENVVDTDWLDVYL
jgi:ribonuclease HI